MQATLVSCINFFRKLKSVKYPSGLLLGFTTCWLTHFAQILKMIIWKGYFSEECKHEHTPLTYRVDDSCTLNCPITLAVLKDTIDRTKVCTLGENKISAALFKELDYTSFQLLRQLFNNIRLSGDIPSSWTSVVLIKILKPGKQKILVSSYRPTVLNSVFQNSWKKNLQLVNSPSSCQQDLTPSKYLIPALLKESYGTHYVASRSSTAQER